MSFMRAVRVVFFLCIIILLMITNIFLTVVMIKNPSAVVSTERKFGVVSNAGYIVITKEKIHVEGMYELLCCDKFAIFFTMRPPNFDGVKVFPNRIFRLEKIRRSGGIYLNSLETCRIVNVTPLWNKSYYGEGIIVAVVDSGISPHVELRGKILKSKSFVSKKYGFPRDEPYTTDPLRHGTAVAGIIAGEGKKPEGKGIAPLVKLLNARVFNSSGIATEAAIIAAIKWSVENGADVINLSLGAEAKREKTPLQLVLEWAVKNGVIVVCAAGNNGFMNVATSSITDPAVNPMVITVGASYGDFFVAFYSGTGPTHDFLVKPDLVAPGNVIAPVGLDDYEYVMGTSFAAPHVSGVCALLLEVLWKEFNLTKSAWKKLGAKLTAIILGILRRSAKDLGESVLRQGAGLVNAGLAYHYLKKLPLTAVENMTLPAILDVFPYQIPDELGFPWKMKVFIGAKIVFNFSIATTFDEIKVSLENLSDIFEEHFQKEIHVDGISVFEFNVSVKNATEGLKRGAIIFSHRNFTLRIPIVFLLRKPDAKVLLDIGYTNWAIDTIYGQFFYLRLFAEEIDVYIEQLFSKQNYHAHFLQKFDVVIIPDPATFDNNRTIRIPDENINVLYEYVKCGGIIVVMAMFPSSDFHMIHNIKPTNNITELNKLAEKFNVKFLTINEYVTLLNKKIIINQGSWLLNGLRKLPIVGTGLEALGNSVESLAWTGDDVDVILLSRVDMGFALFIATNFLADNFAFNGIYGNLAQDIKSFWSRLFLFRRVVFSPIYEEIGREMCEIHLKIIQPKPERIVIYQADVLGVRRVDYTGEKNEIIVRFSPRCGGEQKLIVLMTGDTKEYGFEHTFWVSDAEREPPRIIYPHNYSIICDGRIYMKIIDESEIIPFIRIKVKSEFRVLSRSYDVKFSNENKTLFLLIFVSRNYTYIEIYGEIFDINGNKLRFQLLLRQSKMMLKQIITIIVFAGIVAVAVVVIRRLRNARKKNIIFCPSNSNKNLLV